jgi:hypothetical protein
MQVDFNSLSRVTRAMIIQQAYDDTCKCCNLATVDSELRAASAFAQGSPHRFPNRSPKASRKKGR